MRNTMPLAVLAAGILLTGCGARTQNEAPTPTAQAPASDSPVPQGPGQPGQKAFDLTGRTLQGKPVRLSDYRGKVVLLNFFGST